MSPDSMVVEDGVDEPAPGLRSRSGWSLVAIGFAFGLAMGAIVFLPGPSTPVAEEADFADGPMDRLSPEDSGVSRVVPGFPDALVAIGDGAGSGLELVLWPLRGPLITRPMTYGNDVVVDATGDYYAMSSRIPDLDGLLLSMGRSSEIRPVQTGVTSYAWHDSEGGRLAYTTEDDQGWHLYTITPRFSPEEVPTSGYPGSTVVAWGHWGYVLQRSDDTVLLTTSGEFRGIQAGSAVVSHPIGWILVEDGGFKLVSSGGGVRLLDFAEHVGSSFAGAFSPDGERLAVAGDLGLVVYDRIDHTSVTFAAYAGEWLSWSSDSRFVIAPSNSGVVLHDLDTGESHRVLVGHDVVVAAAVPLSRS